MAAISAVDPRVEQLVVQVEGLVKESQRRQANEAKQRSTDSQTVSYEDYCQEKLRENRVLLASFNPDTSVNFPRVPKCLSTPKQGPEKDAVRPFWKTVVANNTLVSGLRNGYEAGSLGSKVPHVSFFPKSCAKPQPGDFVAVGDCKGHDWTGTSTSDLGQLMLYCHKIMDAQPHRKHVYGFLTNNTIFVVVCTRRDDNYVLHWSFSSVLTFKQGLCWFLHLLRTDSGHVPLPRCAKSLQIVSSLRPGGSCRAYFARDTIHQLDVVVKIYARGDDATIEVNNVRMLAAAVNGMKLPARIPTIVGHEGCWVVASPFGTPFTSMKFSMSHARALVETLEAIHSLNFVHWDVRFSNILQLNESVLLNDWGSLVQAGVETLVRGCPESLRHPELNEKPACAPHPRHDLYSLVMSIAELFEPGYPIAKRKLHYKDALEAAHHGLYSGVLVALESIGIPI
eukprot:c5121_g1_i2.p1 GENE.c5121_g1_i2~~c5121_g1_i2.p1  ORF type:complete len:453 (+),score=61.61 c5121_g1_i2:396-1754(+)